MLRLAGTPVMAAPANRRLKFVGSSSSAMAGKRRTVQSPWVVGCDRRPGWRFIRYDYLIVHLHGVEDLKLDGIARFGAL